MVIVHEVSWPTDRLLKKTGHSAAYRAGQCHRRGKRISPELIQGHASAAAVCREAAALLEDRTLSQRTQREPQDLRRTLGEDGGVEKLAAPVREMVGVPKASMPLMVPARLSRVCGLMPRHVIKSGRKPDIYNRLQAGDGFPPQEEATLPSFWSHKSSQSPPRPDPTEETRRARPRGNTRSDGR